MKKVFLLLSLIAVWFSLSVQWANSRTPDKVTVTMTTGWIIEVRNTNQKKCKLNSITVSFDDPRSKSIYATYMLYDADLSKEVIISSYYNHSLRDPIFLINNSEEYNLWFSISLDWYDKVPIYKGISVKSYDWGCKKLTIRRKIK